MALLEDIGNGLGFGDLDRGQNEFRDPNQDNFQLPGYKNRKDRYEKQLGYYQNREAPQAGDSQFREDQRFALDRFKKLANGEDSLNAELGQAAAYKLAQEQRSLAAGASPTNAAMAQRMAMRNIGAGQSEIDRNTRIGQIQERLGALGAYGQLASGAREQDLGLNKFNVGATLQNRGMNDNMVNSYEQLDLNNALGQQRGNMGYEDSRTQRFGALLNNPTTGERALGFLGGLTGGILNAGQGGGGGGDGSLSDSDKLAILGNLGSDERIKKNVRNGAKVADQILPGELSKFSGDAPPAKDKDAAFLSREKVIPRKEELSREKVPLDKRARPEELSREKFKLPRQHSASPMPPLDAPKLDKLGRSMSPQVFEYKNPSMGTGPRLGVMAQDVEAGGPLGRNMVSDRFGFKTIDIPKATGTNLALTARISDRVDALESKLRKKK